MMKETQEIKYKNPLYRNARFKLLIMMFILVTIFLGSFCFGRYSVPLISVLRIFADRISDGIRLIFADFPELAQDWSTEMETVVINIRLPRILLACMVGCCLSAAGAAYQGVFRNPMASPDILGASSGAAFGAALAILLGASTGGITVAAFIVGLATVCVVYVIGLRVKGDRVVGLILAGIMISSIFSAGTSYIKLVADPTNQLPAITYWLMGSLSGARLTDVVQIFWPMAAGLMLLFLLRWRINVLVMGEESAKTLGVNVNALRFVIILCATLVTAASISVSGMIGWVGLVIPHICRRILGNNYKYLLPASMITGAAFLLVVDNVSRNLLETEIPIGILTAFIGAPFFILLIMRRKKI